MDKFESKAKEILARVESLMAAFEPINRRYDEYYAPDSITCQFPDVLLDAQILFFADSPQNPLYVRAMRLNDRIERMNKSIGSGDRYHHGDFEDVRELLSRFLEYLSFRSKED